MEYNYSCWTLDISSHLVSRFGIYAVSYTMRISGLERFGRQETYRPSSQYSTQWHAPTAWRLLARAVLLLQSRFG